MRSTSYRSEVTCDKSGNGREDTLPEMVLKIIPEDDIIRNFLFMSNYFFIFSPFM